MAERATSEPIAAGGPSRRAGRVLGAVLAGGRSRRFGSDKAAALLGGVPLLDVVAAAIAPQVEWVVVCGRDGDAYSGLADRPGPDLGPLGGLCAALAYAEREGFETVLTIGCDVPDPPADLVARLGAGPTFVVGQPVVGLWPARLSAVLDTHLVGAGDRSMRRWIAACGAVGVEVALANVNRVEDLARVRGT